MRGSCRSRLASAVGWRGGVRLDCWRVRACGFLASLRAAFLFVFREPLLPRAGRVLFVCEWVNGFVRPLVLCCLFARFSVGRVSVPFVFVECFLMAGFHVGVRGKAAGRVVRCSAKAGACRLVGADGELTPHFGSVAEGEAFLAEQEAAQRGGFTASSAASGGAVSSVVGDGRGISWDDARACVGTVSAPNGTLVVGPSADSGVPARLVRGLVGAEPFGNMWRVPAGGRAFGDDVSVQGTCVVEDARDVLFTHVTNGALVGEARGVRFEHVYAGGMVGEAKHCFIGSVGGGEVSPGVPGGGSVSVVTDGSAVGCVAGDEYGKAHVGRVEGGSHVSAVLADGSVDIVSGGSRVDLVEGAGGVPAEIGVVDLSGRVGVVGGGARVGFTVDADSVDGLSDGEAGWLLTRRLRSDAVRDRDSGLRVSDGVGLWARGAGSWDDRVVLSAVGRDGSRVTLGDAEVRRVLAGRPSASEWDVESMLGSFDAAFERNAGAWAAGAGDVVLPPSGWDDDMVPAVDDDDE